VTFAYGYGLRAARHWRLPAMTSSQQSSGGAAAGGPRCCRRCHCTNSYPRGLTTVAARSIPTVAARSILSVPWYATAPFGKAEEKACNYVVKRTLTPHGCYTPRDTPPQTDGRGEQGRKTHAVKVPCSTVFSAGLPLPVCCQPTMYAPVPGSEDDADRQPSPREWRSRSSYGSTASNVLCCTCEMPQFEMTPERRNMLVSYLSGLLVRPRTSLMA